MEKQNLNSKSTKLMLNLKEFLAEFFVNRIGEKVQFSYGLFWDAITNKDIRESIRISTNYEQKEDGSFYYEYGLLKAEEEMESELLVTETFIRSRGVGVCRVWVYNIYCENAEEPPVSYYFYSNTRIMAFIQHEEETMNLAAEMLEITKQKPVLCLESHKHLFCEALDNILEAYSDDYYDKTELQAEYQNNAEIADWMRYKFRCSHDYEAYGDAIGNNVGNAIDAAWTWFRTGYINNFISIDPKTKRINLNW